MQRPRRSASTRVRTTLADLSDSDWRPDTGSSASESPSDGSLGASLDAVSVSDSEVDSEDQTQYEPSHSMTYDALFESDGEFDTDMSDGTLSSTRMSQIRFARQASISRTYTDAQALKWRKWFKSNAPVPTLPVKRQLNDDQESRRFPYKVMAIVQDNTDDSVTWHGDDGTFVVHDIDKLAARMSLKPSSVQADFRKHGFIRDAVDSKGKDIHLSHPDITSRGKVSKKVLTGIRRFILRDGTADHSISLVIGALKGAARGKEDLPLAQRKRLFKTLLGTFSKVQNVTAVLTLIRWRDQEQRKH